LLKCFREEGPVLAFQRYISSTAQLHKDIGAVYRVKQIGGIAYISIVDKMRDQGMRLRWGSSKVFRETLSSAGTANFIRDPR